MSRPSLEKDETKTFSTCLLINLNKDSTVQYFQNFKSLGLASSHSHLGLISVLSRSRLILGYRSRVPFSKPPTLIFTNSLFSLSLRFARALLLLEFRWRRTDEEEMAFVEDKRRRPKQTKEFFSLLEGTKKEVCLKKMWKTRRFSQLQLE